MLQFIEPFSSLSCLLCSSAMHVAMCLLCPERFSDSGFTWALLLTPFTCRRHAHCTRRYDYRRFSPSAFAKVLPENIRIKPIQLERIRRQTVGGFIRDRSLRVHFVILDGQDMKVLYSLVFGEK